MLEPLQVVHLLPNDKHHLCLWGLPQSLQVLCCVFFLNGFPFSLGVFSIWFHMWYQVQYSNHSGLRQTTEAAPFSITGFWALCSGNLTTAPQHVLSSSGKSLQNTVIAEECPVNFSCYYSLCVPGILPPFAVIPSLLPPATGCWSVGFDLLASGEGCLLGFFPESTALPQASLLKAE